MQVYIPSLYFSVLENLLVKVDVINGVSTGLIGVIQLFNAMHIFTDISNIEFQEMVKSINNNKTSPSLKDLIIRNAIKDQRLTITSDFKELTPIQNLSSFYFLNIENAIEITKNNGIVCVGDDFEANTFYANCNVSDLKITNSWNEIKNYLPPTNAMLIVDPYIFTPDKKSPFKKIESLVKFIELYKADISIPFHLTIIAEIGKEGGTSDFLNKAFDKLKMITGCQVQICLSYRLPTSDRRFFTNYTSGNFGHPFDRDTVFNQNFLGASDNLNKIKLNYRQYKSELEEWLSFFNESPKLIGVTQCKWETSEFVNRLFIS
jgi:hypothetical protein